MKVRGDVEGVRACQRLCQRQKEDMVEVLSTAKRYGRAFVREQLGGMYRIWEVRPAGSKGAEVEGFQVRLFQAGATISGDRSE